MYAAHMRILLMHVKNFNLKNAISLHTACFLINKPVKFYNSVVYARVTHMYMYLAYNCTFHTSPYF